MSTIRDIVSDTLSTILSKKVSKSYEKEIFKLCLKLWGKPEDWDNYEFINLVSKIEYEKLGMLMVSISKKDRKKILNDIRSCKVSWESCVYKDIQNDIKNNIEMESKPIEVAEGVFKCYKCGDNKTTSVAFQLRSADEPMTNFVTCVTCGNKWKC